MAMRRTTVFASEEDLAVIKAAALRRGMAEAELIRDAIHLVALAERQWDEPFFTGSFSRLPVMVDRSYADVVDDVRSDAVARYVKSRTTES